MKRTKHIPLHRFRKRTGFPLASLLYFGALAAPLFLTGCDGSSTTQPFSTISQCQQTYNYTAEHCRQIYGQAIDRAKLDGKNYQTQAECMQDNANDPNRQQRCQYTHHGSAGGHFFYIPQYYSYTPGSYAQPFYRSSYYSGFRSARGQAFEATSGGFSRSTSRSSFTSSRGGFGHTASSHSAGHSSGG